MNKPKTIADKYLKDGVDVGEFVSKFDEYYDTKAENYIGTKIDFLKAFLREPIKPTLTENEKTILRSIHESYGYIGRIEETKRLYICEQPKMGYYQFFNGFHFMFKFIKPRRRI